MENKIIVYILLDCSSSMIGEPIESARQAIRAMISEWKESQKNIMITMLTYQTVAREILREVPLSEFVLPRVLLGGLSCLSEATTLLMKIIHNTECNNEKKPLVFLFTDGKIAENDINNLQKCAIFQKINCVLCEAGAESNLSPLKKMLTHTITLNTLTYGEFEPFLEYL